MNVIVKPKPFAQGFSNWLICYMNKASWIQPFLSWFEYDIIFIYLALASFDFSTPIDFLFFWFGQVESS